jgi:hypothetical protein
MKIKQQYKGMAFDADFTFWENEQWGPGPDHIDWGSNYDKQVNKFGDNIIKHLTQRLLDSGLINIPMANQIYSEYGIKQ